MAERRIGHGGLQRGIVDAVEFEREEQQMDRGRRDALIDVAIEFGALRIGHVAGMDELGIGADAAERVVERLVALDRGGQRPPGTLAHRHLGELALIRLLEGATLVLAILQVPPQLRAFHTRIEVIEIPLRQVAEFG